MQRVLRHVDEDEAAVLHHHADAVVHGERAVRLDLRRGRADAVLAGVLHGIQLEGVARAANGQVRHAEAELRAVLTRQGDIRRADGHSAVILHDDGGKLVALRAVCIHIRAGKRQDRLQRQAAAKVTRQRKQFLCLRCGLLRRAGCGLRGLRGLRRGRPGLLLRRRTGRQQQSR